MISVLHTHHCEGLVDERLSFRAPLSHGREQVALRIPLPSLVCDTGVSASHSNVQFVCLVHDSQDEAVGVLDAVAGPGCAGVAGGNSDAAVQVLEVGGLRGYCGLAVPVCARERGAWVRVGAGSTLQDGGEFGMGVEGRR